LQKGFIEPGIACNIQGILINSGDISSALWSLVVALHTFCLFGGGQRWRDWAEKTSRSGNGRWFLCSAIWIMVFFIGIIGVASIEKLEPEKGPFCMSPSPF